MPAEEKPYRLYRGGRAKGRVPLARHLPQKKGDAQRAGTGPGAPGTATRTRKPRRIGRWVLVTLAALLVLAVVWGVAGYLSFRSGVKEANARIPGSVDKLLTPQDGLLTSTPTTILVLGTDGSVKGGRADANRTDSIMLLRTDPRRHRLAFLSIPRDLRVEIPDVGEAKVNAAYQYGGATLALRTIKELTGLEVNHIAVVDFDRFRELIDAVGGIEVNVPRPIRSSRFDCPYKTAQRCAQWQGWRFERGLQHMDGRRALVYSRIRKNELDPSETDLDRARRQQQVVQATADRISGFRTALRMPFIGDEIVRPLATDLSAGQLVQLGWAYFRADPSRALHCRLGGDPASVGGESVILGSEDNVAAVAMFLGKSAPLPPPKGLPYAPGCAIGDREL
jgi:polyisoprenyl-teichoic acid--peptidoglycan teichoic acid transferase